MPNKRRYEMSQQTLGTRLINLSYTLTVHMAKVIHSSMNKEIQQRLENKCHILDTSPHIENQVTIANKKKETINRRKKILLKFMIDRKSCLGI